VKDTHARHSGREAVLQNGNAVFPTINYPESSSRIAGRHRAA
jgi:hypothetical protein